MTHIDHTKLMDVASEFFDNYREDPNYPGNVFKNRLPEDVSDVIEDLMYVRKFKNVTLHIAKEEDSEYISFETVSRSNDDTRLTLNEIERCVNAMNLEIENNGTLGLIEYLKENGIVLLKVKSK